MGVQRHLWLDSGEQQEHKKVVHGHGFGALNIMPLDVGARYIFDVAARERGAVGGRKWGEGSGHIFVANMRPTRGAGNFSMQQRECMCCYPAGTVNWQSGMKTSFA